MDFKLRFELGFARSVLLFLYVFHKFNQQCKTKVAVISNHMASFSAVSKSRFEASWMLPLTRNTPVA